MVGVPLVSGRSVVVTQGRYRFLVGLRSCPALGEHGRVGFLAGCRAGGRLGDAAFRRAAGRFGVSGVVGAHTGSRAAAVVGVPLVSGRSVVVTQGRDTFRPDGYITDGARIGLDSLGCAGGSLGHRTAVAGMLTDKGVVAIDRVGLHFLGAGLCGGGGAPVTPAPPAIKLVDGILGAGAGAVFRPSSSIRPLEPPFAVDGGSVFAGSMPIRRLAPVRAIVHLVPVSREDVRSAATDPRIAGCRSPAMRVGSAAGTFVIVPAIGRSGLHLCGIAGRCRSGAPVTPGPVLTPLGGAAVRRPPAQCALRAGGGLLCSSAVFRAALDVGVADAGGSGGGPFRPSGFDLLIAVGAAQTGINGLPRRGAVTRHCLGGVAVSQRGNTFGPGRATDRAGEGLDARLRAGGSLCKRAAVVAVTPGRRVGVFVGIPARTAVQCITLLRAGGGDDTGAIAVGVTDGKCSAQSVRYDRRIARFKRIGTVNIIPLGNNANPIPIGTYTERVKSKVIVNFAFIERVAMAIRRIRRAQDFIAGKILDIGGHIGQHQIRRRDFASYPKPVPFIQRRGIIYPTHSDAVTIAHVCGIGRVDVSSLPVPLSAIPVMGYGIVCHVVLIQTRHFQLRPTGDLRTSHMG